MGCLLTFYYYLVFAEIPSLDANRVDTDQRSRSAVSDWCLHCLPMSFYGTLSINGLWDTKHKWIKNKNMGYFCFLR